jgi:hypothetical protein
MTFASPESARFIPFRVGYDRIILHVFFFQTSPVSAGGIEPPTLGL